MLNKGKLSQYKRAHKKWKEKQYEAASKIKAQKEYHTASGMTLSELYGPESIQELSFWDNIGYPGYYPYTRGIQPTMYRGRLWTMRQYAGFGTAEATNQRFRYLIDQGQTGLSVAFDLPTQIGLDSDHSLAQGEVGKVGVAISSIEDMELLFKDIPLDKVSTSMTINATAPILLSMYIVLAKKKGIPWDALSGTVQNDILKEYIARGTYIYPIEPSLKLVVDVIEFCGKACPGWNTISISGYHIREAGSDAIQELAFTFANAITYIDETLKRGMPIDSFAPRLSFFFNSHNDFFEEIAKFRAARKIWSRIIKERYGALDPRSFQLRFHTQTAGSTLTAQQPYNNIIRVTLQALAAVLGGTQSLHTNAYDEALSLPSEESALLALRTQQIIAYESGTTNTIDPVAGSFFLEYLVSEIEEKVFDYIEKIQKMGGVIEAIRTGFIQREIHNTAFQSQRNIEKNQSIIVGLNKYVESSEQSISLLRIDRAIEEAQVKKLLLFKKARNSYHLQESLIGLQQNAKDSSANTIPFIIAAVEAGATVGEIASVLRGVYGEYSESQ
ncbi:MAG: methylmalonyl-CoA mutase [Candidatus Fischerbacteria bacterium RBG_13_37_8]|uniref:Methylmalonyl-CoA mutase n=1 Tax=Candidatus Fischerbacteria bacterium RBG_13_37_8 TaxID=1817863 RepID=A0A1F5VX87_9BACT|nr:MAG: methylmalonyl-CoA mutase [Candidatus Fischerbacteria bacterium RBG_13_37_8]